MSLETSETCWSVFLFQRHQRHLRLILETSQMSLETSETSFETCFMYFFDQKQSPETSETSQTENFDQKQFLMSLETSEKFCL